MLQRSFWLASLLTLLQHVDLPLNLLALAFPKNQVKWLLVRKY
jgi:hypothetical protein